MREWWRAMLAVLCLAVPAAAQETYPDRPGPRDFIVDEAQLLPQGSADLIRGICDRLLTERAVSIQVVTIRSLADHGAGRWRIERYAHALFDEWGIGYEERNLGILLLVSPGDRKARIELGAEWGGGKHRRSQEIMDTLLVPRFKAGDFAGGIEAGVAGLDAMVRDLAVPARYRPKTPPWVIVMWLAFAGLAVFTAVSLFRRGASGWAWLFWAGAFTLTFLLLRGLAEASASRRGGGFGGGSFGGGFSGGGGAAGSW